MNPKLAQTFELARTILKATEELTELHNRNFTLDGHTLGSLGEVIARHMFGLRLVEQSTRGYDAEVPETGKKVEIKVVGAKATKVSFYADHSAADAPAARDQDAIADHIICMQLAPDSPDLVRVIVNAPYDRIRRLFATKPGKNGQRSVALTRLSKAQQSVPLDEQLPRVDA